MLLTFIELPFVSKLFVLSIFEWPLKTGFTVYEIYLPNLVQTVRLDNWGIPMKILSSHQLSMSIHVAFLQEQ